MQLEIQFRECRLEDQGRLCGGKYWRQIKGKIGRYHCMMEQAQENPNLVHGLGKKCDEGRVASGED